VSTQTKRHAWIARWLGIHSLVFVVNKMDGSNYSREKFEAIEAQLSSFPGATTIPASALHGDNIWHPSQKMPWYQGPCLREWLQSIEPQTSSSAVRFSVQYVLSDGSLAGQLLSGTITAPAALQSARGELRVEEIHRFPKRVASAGAGEALRLKTTGAALRRGDLVYDSLPMTSDTWEAEWLVFDETTSPLLARTHSWEGHVAATKSERVWDWDNLRWIPLTSSETFPRLHHGTLVFDRTLASDPFLAGSQMGQMVFVDTVTGKTVAAVLLRQRC
jgi:sulfate adenylyltransferase subunit 1 (EFTu-like GTPase family)